MEKFKKWLSLKTVQVKIRMTSSEMPSTLELALSEALSNNKDGDVTQDDSGDTEKVNKDQTDKNEDVQATQDSSHRLDIDGITATNKRGESIDSLDSVNTENKVKRETLFFLELNDKTQASSFRPEDGDKDFPINASGQVDNILILSQDKTFSVYLEADDDRLLDNKSWSTINSNSQELPHVGGYQKQNGDYVLSISDYPFNEKLDFSIQPTQETTFRTIRVEVMIDEYTRGPK